MRRARCGRCQAKSADNTGCCKGERRQWRIQRTEAGAAVAECEGLLPPKHDAGTATRHYRAFWQRRCRAAAARAVLKPQGGNCAVLPKEQWRWIAARSAAQEILGWLYYKMCDEYKPSGCPLINCGRVGSPDPAETERHDTLKIRHLSHARLGHRGRRPLQTKYWFITKFYLFHPTLHPKFLISHC